MYVGMLVNASVINVGEVDEAADNYRPLDDGSISLVGSALTL